MRRTGLLLALAAAVAGCGGSEAQRGDLLVTADRLFDGRRMIEPGAVLISGRTIAAVGADLDAEAKRRIDLDDATILPGFIDLHVHGANDANVGALIGGVTTVRDLGAPLGGIEPPRARPGALRVLYAGPLLTVPGGYPIPVHTRAIALPFRGSEGARKAVALVAERGAAVVKLALQAGWPMPSRTEAEAVVREAHR